jgi:hypothetical protein
LVSVAVNDDGEPIGSLDWNVHLGVLEQFVDRNPAVGSEDDLDAPRFALTADQVSQIVSGILAGCTERSRGGNKRKRKTSYSVTGSKLCQSHVVRDYR